MKKRLALLVVLTLCLSSAGAAGMGGFQPIQTYPQGMFQDVTATDWFFPDVVSAYELGLMNGTDAAAFSPQGPVTLAAAITLCARLQAAWFGDTEAFDQSTGAHWYDVYVSFAVKRGIWTPDTETDYEAPVSRGQLAALLWAALPENAYSPVNQVDDGAIPDVAVGHPQSAAIYGLYRAGMLTGQGEDGAFFPDRPLTRAELAAVTVRATDPDRRQSVTLINPALAAASARVNDVADLVNEARAQAGLPPLTLMPELSQAAQVRAEETTKSFAHTRPDGRDCFTVLAEVGITCQYTGENIAMGQRTAQEVMETWMNSPGHRENILDPGFARLGVACVERGGSLYWVQLFIN